MTSPQEEQVPSKRYLPFDLHTPQMIYWYSSTEKWCKNTFTRTRCCSTPSFPRTLLSFWKHEDHTEQYDAVFSFYPMVTHEPKYDPIGLTFAKLVFKFLLKKQQTKLRALGIEGSFSNSYTFIICLLPKKILHLFWAYLYQSMGCQLW